MRRNEPSATDGNGAASLRRKGRSYILLTLVLIAISVLSVWMISRFFGDGDFYLSFEFLTGQVLLGLIALLAVYYALDTLRFLFVLKTLGFRLPFFYILKLSFVNIFVSAVTPFAAGGGFVQVYFLVKKGVSFGSAMAASTIRTLLSMSILIIVAPVIAFMNPALLDALPGPFIFLLMVTIAFYLGIFALLFRLSVNEKPVKRLILRIMRFLERRRLLSRRRTNRVCLTLFTEARRFTVGVRMFLRGKKSHLSLSVLFTVLFLTALFSFTFLLTLPMEDSAPPLVIYQSQILITVMTYFAFTPGASGVAEGGFALLFSESVDSKFIASLTLLWRFFTVYVGTLIGLVLFYSEAFSIKLKKKG
jgi:hypothetical protein